VVTGIGGGAIAVQYFWLQQWVDSVTGLVALGGLIFGCGLPGLAIVRWVFGGGSDHQLWRTVTRTLNNAGQLCGGPSGVVGRGVELLVPGGCVRPGAAVIAVPQAAIDLAKRFEGFHRVPRADPGRAHPYICPAGYWTIGYGHLCDPKHLPITEAEAEGHLAADLRTALNATLRYCPVLATEPEGRLAAIVDFTFNLGAGRLQTSTLRRRVNQREWVAAATELRRWVYGRGRVLAGLIGRRDAEAIWLLRNPPQRL